MAERRVEGAASDAGSGTVDYSTRGIVFVPGCEDKQAGNQILFETVLRAYNLPIGWGSPIAAGTPLSMRQKRNQERQAHI